LLVGGDRTGVDPSMATSGGLATRHGIRVMTWMQDLPDREPLICSHFIAPSLNFVTATSSAVVVWDALSGRPLRVYDNRLCEGREITSVVLDKRQRKIVVGDVIGKQWVINLLSGAVMKQLDPRSSKPRTAVMAAAEQRRKAAIASAMMSAAISSARGVAAGAAALIADVSQSAQPLSMWPASGVNNAPQNAPSTTTAGNAPPTAAGAGTTQSLADLDSKTPRGFQVQTTDEGLHKAVKAAQDKANAAAELDVYISPLLQLSYSARQEVVSTSADGSVWICEERSDGWSAGTMSSTIVRVMCLPLEQYRAPAPVTSMVPFVTNANPFEDPDPLTSAVHGANGFGFVTSSQTLNADGTMQLWTANSSSSSAAVSSASSTSPRLGASVLPPGALSSIASMSSMPSAIEGGASILSLAGEARVVPALALGTSAADASAAAMAASANTKPATAAGSSSAPTSTEDSTGRTHLPPLDGTVRVTCVAHSVRLNLLVTCSRLLRDPPRTAKEGEEEEQTQSEEVEATIAQASGADAGKTSAGRGSGLVDDDSFLLLLFDYEKATFLGAFARAPTDRKGGLRSVVERFNAANVLATLDAVSITQALKEGDGQGGKESLKLAAASGLLLSPATAMQFLDPLAALATAHEDGAIRIWAVPPSKEAYTLRMIFYVPANPSMALYSRAVKKVAQAAAKRQLTNAAKRLVTKVGGPTNDLGSDGKKRDGSSAAAARGRRRSSVAGEDPDDIPALMQRRFAISMTTRPAHLTPAMHLGTLFPHGHAAYMPGGKVTPYAPAPGQQIFHDNAHGPEATGHVDQKKYSLDVLHDPEVATTFAATAEDIVI
jgi:hypothetical protein